MIILSFLDEKHIFSKGVLLPFKRSPFASQKGYICRAMPFGWSKHSIYYVQSYAKNVDIALFLYDYFVFITLNPQPSSPNSQLQQSSLPRAPSLHLIDQSVGEFIVFQSPLGGYEHVGRRLAYKSFYNNIVAQPFKIAYAKVDVFVG